ncbi:hypothetical protein V6V47_18255 [Micromonospora sp. CPCC 205539]|uniref:hypothetical protein n=1 Tax=Micromonospora sp. CPCC 205539 TaxID=3122408 RepID=UPI002FF1E67B
MSHQGTDPAIQPAYRYNAPGRPLRLYKGQISGVASDRPLRGEIRMDTSSNMSIAWRVDPAGSIAFGKRALSLNLNGALKSRPIEAFMRTWEAGWINEAELGSTSVKLAQAKLHWFNLPALRSARLVQSSESGTPDFYRWEMEVAGWRLRLDRRSDYRAVWADLHSSDKFLMTHVMEVAKADATDFTVDELKSLRLALHMAFSFAFGCHIAPALPVGYDRLGRAVWKHWFVPHCDPARSISPGWWAEFQGADLDSYLQLAIPALSDSLLGERLRYQTMFAIACMIPTGFLEPRIMVGFAGLEHFIWHRLVVDRQMSRSAFDQLKGHERLRHVLNSASIPVNLEPAITPALHAFAQAEVVRQGRMLDAADIATQIRNRIVHPTDLPRLVYHINDLITEAWALTRHFLTLLILHALGYRGSQRDLRRLTGSAHDVAPVPWS